MGNPVLLNSIATLSGYAFFRVTTPVSMSKSKYESSSMTKESVVFIGIAYMMASVKKPSRSTRLLKSMVVPSL